MINPNFLESDEFLVECEVRQIKGSLMYQLKELQEALAEESNRPEEVTLGAHPKAYRNPRQELTVCSGKLTDIQATLEGIMSLENSKRIHDLDIIGSRILHIQGRLKRISTSKNAGQQALKLVERCNTFIALVDELKQPEVDLEKSIKSIRDIQLNEPTENITEEEANTKLEKQDHTSQNYVSTNSKDIQPTSSPKNLEQPWSDMENDLSMVLDELSKRVRKLPQVSSDIQQKCRDTNNTLKIVTENHNINSTPTANTGYSNNYSSTQEKVVPIAVHKWNIQFDGSPTGVNIERFIFRVEHLAQSHNIFVGRLVHDLGFLLKGVAREFYWHYLEREKDVTWAQLRGALIDRFKDRRTDTDIRRELDGRKQKVPKENFVEFYNEMMALTMALQTPISDAEFKNILMQNMRPGLQLILAGKTFSTIPKLVSRCIATEDSWRRLNYIPEQGVQQRRTINELSLDSIYEYSSERFPNPTISSLQASPNSFKTNNLPQTHHQPPNQLRRGRFSSDALCWNCEIIGHVFMDCPLPLQHMFCFGCGYPNVLKPHCSRCTPENSNPGNSNPGMRSGGPHFRKILNRVSEMQATENMSNTQPEVKDRHQEN